MLPPTAAAAARVAPSSALRLPQAALFMSRAIYERQSLRRNAILPPKFANAPLRRLTATRTQQTARASSSTALSLEEGDGGGDEKGLHPQPDDTTQELLPPPSPRLALPLAWRALEAALWPELVITWFSAKKREATAYLALSRPWNLVPSISMVFAGAAAATARAGGLSSSLSSAALSPSSPSSVVAAASAASASALLSLLSNSRVWHAALSTAAIALGSMAVNDYFDVPNDRINAPTKPLPSGLVSIDGALLFGGALYLATLVAAAWLEPRELRLLVASSAAVTLAYTPVFKKIALAKTAAVAGVVALSPAAGALAATNSSSTAALAAVAPACLLAFFTVSGRELLMDSADARGDGAAGVATLPILIGRRATLVVATGCEVLAAAVLTSRAVASFLLRRRQGEGSPLPLAIPVAAVVLGSALVLPAARAARAALELGRLKKEKKKKMSSGVSPASLIEGEARVAAAISEAVNSMMKPAAMAVITALALG